MSASLFSKSSIASIVSESLQGAGSYIKKYVIERDIAGVGETSKTEPGGAV